MKPLRAILVEDEPSGMENLRWKLINHCPEVEIVAECSNGSDAIQQIKKHLPDVLFLDILLGDMTGFDVLKAINHPTFEIIFTTSYDEFAIEAIKNQALDYLVKPVLVDELQDAVAKARVKRQSTPSAPAPMVQRSSEPKFAFPVSTGKLFLDLKEIIYAQADDNVALLHIDQQKEPISLTRTLGWLEEELSAYNFCRVHHSYLINFHHVKEYIRNDGGYVILSNGKAISISRRRKDHFLTKLETWNQ